MHPPFRDARSGKRPERLEATFYHGGSAEGKEGDVLAQVVGREPTPEFAAQVAEECQRLLDALDDPELRQLAPWKMEGYTNEEIADRLGCVGRTVERKLKLVRSLLWTGE